jgi:hypothetical protein
LRTIQVQVLIKVHVQASSPSPNGFGFHEHPSQHPTSRRGSFDALQLLPTARPRARARAGAAPSPQPRAECAGGTRGASVWAPPQRWSTMPEQALRCRDSHPAHAPHHQTHSAARPSHPRPGAGGSRTASRGEARVVVRRRRRRGENELSLFRLWGGG